MNPTIDTSNALCNAFRYTRDGVTLTYTYHFGTQPGLEHWTVELPSLTKALSCPLAEVPLPVQAARARIEAEEAEQDAVRNAKQDKRLAA